MAIYATIEKIEEDERMVRYKFSDVEGRERFLILDKKNERAWPEDGVGDIQYKAVARQIAVAWTQEGIAADHLIVQS